MEGKVLDILPHLKETVNENYGEFGADGGWFCCKGYSSVRELWPEWTSSQSCSNHHSIGGSLEMACHHMTVGRWYFESKFEKLNWKMWQQNEDAKLKAGLNVYNRSGGGQAIPATPGLPQCHNSMHKATTPRTFVHQSLFTSLCYITTMHFCTNLDQNVPECV